MKRVAPLRKLEQIQRIRRNLKNEKMAVMYCFFVAGINTNLRVSDLRALTWASVWLDGTQTLRDHITLIEQKTKKPRRIFINENVADALRFLLDSLGRIPERDEAIFRNPITRAVYSREHLSRQMGIEARKVGIQDPIAAHSLRKTFGYHAVVTFDQQLAVVQAAFNHSSQRETMLYLGLTDDDIEVIHQTVAL